eukprot:1179146-Prorocentrum_minimum.AAC.2
MRTNFPSFFLLRPRLVGSAPARGSPARRPRWPWSCATSAASAPLGAGSSPRARTAPAAPPATSLYRPTAAAAGRWPDHTGPPGPG